MDEKAEKKEYRDRLRMEAFRKANRDKFVQAALSTKEGRDYFYWLLEICKIGQNPFSSDANVMSLQCGELNVGLQVQAHIIEATPDAYLSMLKDRQKEEVNGRSNSDTDGSSSDDTDSDA